MASRVGMLGWVTGVLSAVLGALAFGAVLCLWFPAVLTTPALRDVYPMEIVRTAIKIALGVAFVLGVISVMLKRRKAFGLTGAGLALLATLMGGSEVAVATPVARSNHVGLDWFLLDLFLLSAIFVPIELLWARLREQSTFRPEWRTDLWHFGVSHLLVQLSVFLTMAPAALFFRWAVEPVDVDFAVHLPVIDAVFGTLYLPDDRWPAAYGLAGPPVPDGYWVQMVF